MRTDRSRCTRPPTCRARRAAARRRTGQERQDARERQEVAARWPPLVTPRRARTRRTHALSCDPPDPTDCTYPTHLTSWDHHTRQAAARTIGALALHANAFWNSGMLDNGPLTRYLFDECGLVAAFTRSASGRVFSHQTCAQPRNTRCSGVKPSTLPAFFAPGPARYAMSARRSPPLAALFSPSVNRPFTCVSPATV